ncbi:hypothetical protein HWV23_08330 [Natronomonas halophila]|uniref:PGF-CTERM sorting domain-containing protein n=1 Tax=Natronomonas halophila TaxID=2747817 RepID=UPI0015B3B7D5|nr:PGF-CTERM sorting domain-containing protein [Natronomonas halophila]QLD85731.1 hypothetical protein HWV23_08330 [Natronomonas halophila]
MRTDHSITGWPRAATAGLVIAVVAVALLAAVAATPAAANHGTDSGNYTVVLPHDSDHLPGNQNEANASIRNFSTAGDRFDEEGAPEGFETFDYLEVRNEAIDWSNCGSANTAVFGLDRGNNNSGTKTDTDLLEHMKNSNFHEDGIDVTFYNESDFGGNPTYLNPDDQIISVQGAGSSGGPCFTMPSDPGWYQIKGMVRGTTADGETLKVQANSHYFPICEGCHDNETAYEKLGPPPSQRSGSQETPTPTPTPTPTATATATPTPTPDDGGSGGEGANDDTPTSTPTPTPTLTPADGDTGSSGGNDGGSNDGGSDSDSDDGVTGDDAGSDKIQGTPTPGAGPGFGAALALVTLLGSALLVRRRG